MSCSCKGLGELIDKLETQFSEKEIKKLEKESLEPVAEKIKKDMKSIAPVCNIPEVHGRDVIGFRYISSRGYVIGLDNHMPDNASHDYWNTIRGLWFSQWGSWNNYKHIGWFTNFARANGRNYMEDGAKNLKEAIEEKLKILKS